MNQSMSCSGPSENLVWIKMSNWTFKMKIKGTLKGDNKLNQLFRFNK